MERSLRALRRAAMLCTLALAACGTGDAGGPDAGSADARAATPTITYEEVVSACVRLNACGVERRVRTADCINDYYDRLVRFGLGGLYAGAYRCVNAAKGDCKGVRGCLGFPSRLQKRTCDRTFKARCDGTVAINCDLDIGTEQRLDCAKGGLRCALKVSGGTREAVCGPGTCSAASHKTRCTRDKKVVRCVGGALEIQDCPAQGLQCRDDVAAVCEGRGRSCPSLAASCDGKGRLVSCRQGYLHLVDCSRQPGRKRCDASRRACAGAGRECQTDSYFDRCVGDSLLTCVDGYRRAFNCKKMGFLGCAKKGLAAVCKAQPIYE